MTTYLITGAAGLLGQLVIDHLAQRVAKDDIIALVRSDAQKAAFESKGIATRYGDYDKPETLIESLQGVDRLLLISGSAIGERVRQHGNVIKAAKQAGVGHIAYTSILRADVSSMGLAVEHKATEEIIQASGIAYALLRNGWYTENMVMGLEQDLEMGQHFGAAGMGQFSTASRNDYAEAAAIVLATDGHAGKTYELAGDAAFGWADYAATVSKAKGTAVTFVNIPEETLKEALVGAGLPEGFAGLLADSDAKAAEGWLFDDSKTLSGLLGRDTATLASIL